MRILWCPLIVFSLAHSVPVHAGSWAMIDSVETKGDRSIYYAQYDDVRVYSDPSLANPPPTGRNGVPALPFENAQVAEVEVMQVFEAADRPRFSNYRVAVDCARSRMRIAAIDSLFRDNLTAFESEGTGWFPPPANGWLNRVNAIGCQRAEIEAAVRKAARDGSLDALMELGLLHIGNFALSYPIVELTWSAFWPDASEPPIRTMSPDEARALRQNNDRRLAELRRQVDGYVAMGQASLDDQNAERDFLSRIRPNFTGKTRVQQVIFGGMAGWTEAEVVEFWGRPARIREIGTVRAFDYQASHDTRQLIVQQMRAGNVAYETGEFESCELTLFMEAGGSKPGLRLIDFAIGGTNCRRATLNAVRP